MRILTIENIIGLSFYLPEFILSCFVGSQLIVNSRLLNILKLKFPVITREVSDQVIILLVGVAYIYYFLLVFLTEHSLVSHEFCGASVLKLLFLLLAALVVYVAKPGINMQKLNNWEYFILYLLAVVSFLLMATVDNFCSFYLVMELQALCFYIMAAMDKESIFSAEAGLKYFISGSIISGCFLLGVSFIYGSVGLINLSAIANFLFITPDPLYTLILLVGVFLVTATLLFKLACAPFHFWAADVYEGAPLSSTVIFSVLPKLAIVCFFFRFLDAFHIFSTKLGIILIYCGVLSAFLGSLYAIRQVKVKKLLIYGSISQTGFLVAGLGAYTLNSKAVVLVFLFIYLLTTLLLWDMITRFYVSMSLVARFKKLPFFPLYITDFSGLGRTNFTYALALIIICFSLGGIPYLAGFVGKASVLQELIHGSYFIPAALLSFISAISVFYYIRMVKMFFFETKKYVKAHPAFMKFSDKHEEMDFKDFLFCCILAFLIVCFFYTEPLFLLARYITDSWFK